MYRAPQNPGIAEEGQIVSRADYLGVAEKIDPDLTVVGAEGPLAEGIVDPFRAAGRRIVGSHQENARLGDLETQPLMHRLDCDFGEVLMRAAESDLKNARLHSTGEPSVCVLLAAQGHPGQVRTGDQPQ